jgi:hypothetical protein
MTVLHGTLRRLTLGALVAMLGFAAPAQAQQPAMMTITLLTQDKGMVDARPFAAKDIVAYVTAQQAARPGLKMIALETCPKVPPDMIQGMMQDLQKKKIMVVLGLNDPSPQVCVR